MNAAGQEEGMTDGLKDYVQIQQYWARFWKAMDDIDYPRILTYLTSDCRWLRGEWCEGHEAILASLKQRPALLVSRHIATNLILEPCEGGYDCQYALTIFGAGRQSADQKPPYTTTGARMADYFARLTKRDGAWKAEKISATLMFERPASV